MTALAKDAKTDQFGETPFPTLLSFLVAAATTIFGGGMVATNAAGNAVPASASTALKVWGVCAKQIANSGAAGVEKVAVQPGAFYMANSAGADAIVAANVGQLCYVADDATVALTDGAGLRPAAGVILNVRTDGKVAVQLGVASLYDDGSAQDNTSAFKARGVSVGGNQANLAAFTVANNGITYVAGDVVILPQQTTALQNGPYVIGTVGGGTAPLTRPSWWPVGGPIVPGAVIEVGTEGTLLSGSSWKALCAKGLIIGTDDPILYPRVVKCLATLVAGTVTLGSTQALYLFSTNSAKAGISITRNTPVTPTLTVGGYQAAVANRTAGVSGTAAAIIIACVGAGTINVDDASTLDVCVTNW